MYTISPETILTFLNDRSIRFPRFQRKQTWKAEQNLKLAISVFKTYPIGVSIINKEEFNKKTTRWLLDGRQRRNALKLMLDDPENIYRWAKKFLKIQNSDQEQEIEDKFWFRIDEYLNYDEDENDSNQNDDDNIDDYLGDFNEDEIEIEAEDFTNEIKEQKNINRKFIGNLDELLFIIKTVHKINPNSSGYSKPFDFTKIYQDLYYVESGKKISGRKLTEFIKDFKRYITAENTDESKESFKIFFQSRYKLNSEQEKKLDLEIEKNWTYIQKSFKIVDIIESRLQEATIGIIQTQNINATDSQMIFKLINDEGTNLSAVEILSAKPSWNIKISSPNNVILKESHKLYSIIKTEIESVVRWDYPATFYERLNNFEFILPKLDYNSSIDKKITLGFKILSGVFEKGIKKEDIDRLSRNTEINWNHTIDDVINDLNDIGKILSDSNYFKYLKSWNQSLLEITSDAITINFVLTVYFDYLRKNKPKGYNTTSKQFINNSLILVDKLIYEYVTRKWRGSSDSKISQNIKSFEALPDKFELIDKNIWIKLLKEINDEYTIEGDFIKFNDTKTILYHQYATNQILGPNDLNIKVHVDHIIPQSLFETSTLKNQEYIKHSLFNLCLLPSKDNIKKGDRQLAAITDKWLKDQIEKYSDIKATDFLKYSNVDHWEDLRAERRNNSEDIFVANRIKLLHN